MPTWQCTCGTVRVAIEDGHGTRLACYCRDCRAFPTLLHHPEMVDAAGGVDLYQTTPDKLTVLQGADHLACLRLTKGGILRWYTTCCDTPFANTLGKPGVPFASISTSPVAEVAALGPVRARVHTGSATGPVPEPSGGTARMLFQAMVRTLGARVRGRHRITPFFGSDGRPVAKPRMITEEERVRAYGPG